jgi:hypothetical protein
VLQDVGHPAGRANSPPPVNDPGTQSRLAGFQMATTGRIRVVTEAMYARKDLAQGRNRLLDRPSGGPDSNESDLPAAFARPAGRAHAPKAGPNRPKEPWECPMAGAGSANHDARCSS